MAAGDEVVVRIVAPPVLEVTPEDIPLEILYEVRGLAGGRGAESAVGLGGYRTSLQCDLLEYTVRSEALAWSVVGAGHRQSILRSGGWR